MKKHVEEAYKEVEYTRSIGPYKIYLQALEEVFDWSAFESFADLGCSNGRLLECVQRKYAHINLLGLEYFEWAKTHADASVRDHIQLADLGKPHHYNRKYDIVNCSEVGEHLEPEVENVFIDNVTSAAKDILILTWSNAKSDTNGQHVNPRPQSYVKSKLLSKGFAYWEEATDKIKNSLRISLEGIGHTWWPDNIMVFKKIAFTPIKSRYFIQGIHTDNDAHRVDLAPHTFRNHGSMSLQSEFKILTEKIRGAVASKKSMSILRASDGDYFFLKKIPIGSATPGKRALTVAYEQINMFLFKSLFWHHTVIALNLGQGSLRAWRSFVMTELFAKIYHKLFRTNLAVFNAKKIRCGFDLVSRWATLFNIFPTVSVWLYSLKRGSGYRTKALELISGKAPSCEAIYALVTTKWIFKNFKNEIGIIAGKEKIELIKELMQKPAYREYVGVDSFTDYIEIPQKGAADNVEQLADSFSNTLSKSKARIFIVGAGSSKMALIPLMQNYSNAVFIDVGAGIDALAGIVCQERPYFANWTNFRLKERDYSKVDFMDQGNPAWNRPHYRTEII